MTRVLTQREHQRRADALRAAGGSVTEASRALGLSEWGMTLWHRKALASQPELFEGIPRPVYAEPDAEETTARVVRALHTAHGRLLRAARALGVERNTLRMWIARIAVERPGLLEGVPKPMPGRDRADGGLPRTLTPPGTRRKIDAVTRYAALDAAGGRVATAARALGISRAALYTWLKKHPRPSK